MSHIPACKPLRSDWSDAEPLVGLDLSHGPVEIRAGGRDAGVRVGVWCEEQLGNTFALVLASHIFLVALRAPPFRRGLSRQMSFAVPSAGGSGVVLWDVANNCFFFSSGPTNARVSLSLIYDIS